MKTPEQKKADELIHEHRMLLMNEGGDYGEEILVSILSEKHALITAEKMLSVIPMYNHKWEHYDKVKRILQDK